MKPRIVFWRDRAGRATEILLWIIGSTMALLIGVQAICRYVFNHSLFWSEEVGRICLVWITFLGGRAAYRRHAHIGKLHFHKETKKTRSLLPSAFLGDLRVSA